MSDLDFGNPVQRAVFEELHREMPRQGPGNLASTRRALALVDKLPGAPFVLDLACGPGMQTRDLARLLPRARIVAIDVSAGLVDEARRHIAAEFPDRDIVVRIGDMASPGVDGVDLAWCEGGAYIIGVENALSTWRGLLVDGGCLAFTDAVWLREDPPAELARFWRAYPDMRTAAERRRQARALGYDVLGTFTLPQAAWWDDYYEPLRRRIASVRASRDAGDADTAAVLTYSEHEIALYERNADYYGYAFIVVRKNDAA